MCEVKKLTLADVEITIQVEQDDTPVKGNLCVSDEPELDETEERLVCARLDRGDILAWCCVTVYARWNGFSGRDDLGGISVERRQDLDQTIADHEMQANALADLQRVLEETHAKLCA